MAIVRNIITDDLYEYLGENRFVNLRTGKDGIVSDEQAQAAFRINIEATQIIMEYPNVKNLIKSLNLKFYNDATFI